MANRYYDRVLAKTTTIQKTVFVNNIVSYMKQYNYMVIKKSEEEIKVDAIVSKKLLSNLEYFLKNNRTPNTRKNRNRRVKTMRQMYNYSTIDYSNAGRIETPPDNYAPDKVGQVSLEQLQQNRKM